MTLLSVRAKEAIKTGLAMAIAFGIALQMGWEKPYWAGFAVAFVSLPMVGQSLHKGVLRMLGTLVGGAVALTLIALFPQDRWWFMVALSSYVGLCTYRMLGAKNPYFYFVAAFVCAVICFDGGANSLSAFQTAVERIQETGLGILVYTLITAFLWPQSSRGVLDDAGCKLAAVQSQLYRTYRDLMVGEGNEGDSRPLRMQDVQLLTQFGQAESWAEADSYEVWEARHQWRRLVHLSTDFGEALERWRETFPESRQLDLPTFFPNLDAVCSEVDSRLVQIERMLAGDAPERDPEPVSLTIDRPEVRELNHFQKAALALIKVQLDRLEGLSQALFDCVADIKGRGPQTSTSPSSVTARKGLAFDPDRFGAAVRVVAGMWLAFLVWIYLDPPAASLLLILPTTIGVVVVQTPWVPVWALFTPFALASALAGVIYVFVMPQLSSYAELGLLIFAVTFAIAYLFSTPRQAVSRSVGLAMFVVFISVENQQTYSFAGYANQVAVFFVTLSILVVVAYIPTSPRPEKTFLRLLRRFFRHGEHLMAGLALDWDQKKGVQGRWRTLLYRDDLLELPEKLQTWGSHIDPRAVPGNTPEQVQALVTSLQALAYRIKELVEAREYPQADLLVRELLEDVRGWRIAIERLFQHWATDPASEPGDDLEARLQTRLAKLEARIEETLGLAEQGQLSDKDYENFYRLLGAFRGLSEAVVEHARLAADIRWARWQEARF